MSISCDIYLNFQRIYPKQNITGSVAITSLTECPIQQILLEVCGIAECQWRFGKHLIKSLKIYKKGTVFSNKQQFFLSRHTLAGGTAGIIIISTTPQIFQFKCNLPEYMPATWSGQYGSIKYIAKVMIKEENGLYTFTKEIKVYPLRNLKLERHLLCEARQDIRRHFRYAVISLGIVELSIWLPLCGIAAGQSLPLLCTIMNNSKIKFGGLIFVLTQIEIYRSNKPTVAVKTYRKDICRIPRMVDILQGVHDYYCMLETNPDIVPTNQFSRCKCCQVTYEAWVSLQGSIPRYNAYGYPNIDSPGIPIIIGTKPLCKWNDREITNEVMAAIYTTSPPIELETLPPDDEVEEMLNIVDEEMDSETEKNLAAQLVTKSLYKTDDEDKGSDISMELMGEDDEEEQTEETVLLI